MTGTTHRPAAPRSEAGIAIAPRLRDQLATMAAGRVLVIDYFAGARCGPVVGDLTATFRPEPTEGGYVQLATVDGVRVFAEGRLIALFADAGPGLDVAGIWFGRHVVVTLQRPERWLAFLERPGICAGKSPWARWRQP